MNDKSDIVVELGVKDVKEVTDFYVNVLGCQLIQTESDDNNVPFWAEVTFGRSRLMFERIDYLKDELPGVTTEPVDPRFCVVMRVEPIAAAKELLVKIQNANVPIATGPTETDYGTFEYSIRDNEGYVIVVAGRD